ncbi:MAG: hypothetical protein ABSD29_15990 [Verrucomicrobiota bacterium]|jgi:hypothetical protein
MFLPKSPYLPNPRLLLELIQRKRYARIARREEQGSLRQWFLLWGRVGKEWLLNPQPAKLRKLLPPPDRNWADPFLWKRGDDWFIFCEEWLYNKPYAHLAVMQLSGEDRAVPPTKPVLVKDHHLSYPFLFEHEGTLHMVPEGGNARAIDVYQCEEFPERWRKRATLMRNVQYADATLFEHQAKWWLLATIKRGLFALNRDLFAFWADTPLTDQWNPHPANPVVRGFASARPAGRPFELGGKLFRPSQNCLVRYGHSLRINEILRLDARSYQERLVVEVKPDWEASIRANHHIDWHEGRVVMDAQRLLPLVPEAEAKT